MPATSPTSTPGARANPRWSLWVSGIATIVILGTFLAQPSEISHAVARSGGVVFMPILIAYHQRRDSVLCALGVMIAYYVVLSIIEIIAGY